jgi:hypothetical protein
MLTASHGVTAKTSNARAQRGHERLRLAKQRLARYENRRSIYDGGA